MVKNIGPINSIVLSRAGESDNIYLKDEDSIETNGLTEVKIIDNQIMNFNNRDEFLPELLNKLKGVEYYLNDFSSTGICYYDILDRYNVQIGENTYSCIMFNDEIDITQGLEENIYTDEPEISQTDYTKADKTDRKINQTYLIVDKQNQKIESVITQTDEQNQKIAKVTQTVEELNSKISDIADITISAEDNDAMLEFTEINQSEPIRIVIRPIIENISYLYPSNNLYPSDTLYSKSRKIRFENTKTGEIFDYELPNDLLYYDSENYDEFILDYDGQSCIVNKRIGYNADGSTHILDKEKTFEYEYPRILLTDGDYKISILGYNTAYLFVRLMAQNIYTTQFATKAEVSSSINQTAQDIKLSVDTKLNNYSTTTEMNSAINISANSITNSVSQTYATKNELSTTKSEIKQTTDSISSEVSRKVGDNEIISKINQSAEQISIDSDKINLNGKTLNLTSDNIAIKSNSFNVDTNGTVTARDINITSGKILLEGGSSNNPNFQVGNQEKHTYIVGDGIVVDANRASIAVGRNNQAVLGTTYDGNNTSLSLSGNANIILRSDDGSVTASSYKYNSLKKYKKDIKKYTGNATDIIKKSNIYSFKYKYQNKDTIGFVIDNPEDTPTQIISEDGKSINSYSVIGLLWKAVQEQQEQIEDLKKEIEKLKEDK